MLRWYSQTQQRHHILPRVALLAALGLTPKVHPMKIYNYAGRNWTLKRRDGDVSILVPCEEDGTPTGEDHCVRMPTPRLDTLRVATIKRSGEAADATRRQG